ncbi:hypothetical protein GCM10025857_32570 [Alicyclobacillus contaminans]|nr:hypothetical protein GCM10025857_32570 [Alicyclobacillus contaminans]
MRQHPVLFLVVIGVVVLIDSIPVIRYMGWHFLTGVNWDLGDMYGNMVVRNGVSAPAGRPMAHCPISSAHWLPPCWPC